MLIVHIITGLGDGGAERSLFQLCRHDATNTHEVISLTGMGKYGDLLRESGINLTCLEMPPGRLTISGIFHLWQRLRMIDPDVIQTWMYHSDLVGGVLARLAGHRNVVWNIRHSDLGENGTSRGTVAVAKVCAKLSAYVPRLIICCAVRSAEAHAAFGYRSDRLIVIPNGYDLSIFRPDIRSGSRLRSELQIDAETPVIGFVARFHSLKDHTNLFAALKQLDEGAGAPLSLLVGTGMHSYNTELTNLIAHYGLGKRVLLLGPRNDIPAVMNALDLHVMSSASEAFPNVLAEAMACGTPCISTDVGDATEIVGDTGWIVPPQDAPALAAAIASALKSREAPDWEVRRNAARKRVESCFSIAHMVECYHDAWAVTAASVQRN